MNNKIIVNADDFGWNESCSKAIIKSFELGYISSTTACVNGSFFGEAITMIKKTPYCNCVGVHINLTEGKPLTEGIKNNSLFCGPDGNFNSYPNRKIILKEKDRQQVLDEITAQLLVFKETGLPIHHVDAHHNVHNAIHIFKIYIKALKVFDVHGVRRIGDISSKNIGRTIIDSFFNSILSRRGYLYSDCFMSLNQYENNIFSDKKIEIMVHPDFDNDRLLINRKASSGYDAPSGKPLKELLEIVNKKNDVLVYDYK